jgi:hypothetical protein
VIAHGASENRDGEVESCLLSFFGGLMGIFVTFRDIYMHCDFNFEGMGPKFAGDIAQPFLNGFACSGA